ncbi:class I SAM-dependent methyltransferase [Streptosporangium sp. NBC_01810]|uniref:hypothetical protein n=1 Tax=Streptosporangium sp. NBC_01810 TaxID=2975951 RepID=UPI002DD8479D|nr:hypothetical protein [Streptosporangium sp. NBC_01810]WSA23767.1 class I SAM-dependent methyltransferase [Streptosporangium sp. NBC_01810]
MSEVMTQVPDVARLFTERALDACASYWRRGATEMRLGQPMFRIAGTVHDQLVPDGIANPYWEVIRQMPSTDERHWQGVTPYGYERDLGISRNDVVSTYSWSIPSPGDITWITDVLAGRGVVEVGAGSGYWAWQLSQAGADVIAYEPNEAADNKFVGVIEPYHPLLRDDASAAGRHPDRALFMSWPSCGGPWAAHALASHKGDLFVYVGETHGGCCGDDDFFDLLDAEWDEIGDSPHHRTWWGINCRLIAYRRKRAAAVQGGEQ